MTKRVLRAGFLEAVCFLLFATCALAAGPVSSEQVPGGIYTRPYGDTAQGVSAALIADQLASAPLAAPLVIAMPEPSYPQLLAFDLLTAAGLFLAARRILRRAPSRA